MKIAIVSGKDEGPTKLNAFDNALSDAGIGDVNLIKVSSMLAGNAEIVELPYLKAGSMVNCVLSEITSNVFGEEITAAVAVAIGEELGCVVETTGRDKNPDEVISEAKEMVKYMMDKRGVEIKELIVESSTTTVRETASAVASVVYITDEIISK
ncbi:pyruvoyl-dependent arginine decarboxylase [Methanobrevibacter sp.]|uniref:pyruvoyl-dependent arginine decarboxylase n=1 Tax=Methanobrevibacter sp. TaxID=66852 RepID=UPI00386FCBE2